MKRAAALFACVSLGCASIQSATVVDRDVVTKEGKAIAVLQVDVVGLSLFVHLVPLVAADLDTAVNRILIGEAKHMGGTKVELKEADTTPTGGIYSIVNCLFPIPLILCVRQSHVVGVVIQ